MELRNLMRCGAFAFFAGTLPVGSLHASDLYMAMKQIRHIVVISQENVSFDHYFGVYPHCHAALKCRKSLHEAILRHLNPGISPPVCT